jgi:glucokinase
VRYGVGVDIGGTKVRTALVDSRGSVLAARTCRSAFCQDPASDAAWLIREIESVASEARICRDSLDGICVGVPGVLDAAADTIISCPNARSLEGAGLRSAIEGMIGLPVMMENDVSMAAVAEGWIGAGVGIRDFLFVAIGTGIGLGIVINGALYTGTGNAGEGGHVVVADSGPVCGCGRRGCHETLASGLAIEAAYSRGHSARECVESGGALTYSMTDAVSVSAEEVFRRYRSGDELARRVVEDAAYYMGVGVANLINLFAPELVVIGGGLGVGEWDFISPIVSRICSTHVRIGIRGKYRIEKSIVDVNAGVLGCAKTVFDRISPRGTTGGALVDSSTRF